MSSTDDSKKVLSFMKLWGSHLTVFLLGGIGGYFIGSLF